MKQIVLIITLCIICLGLMFTVRPATGQLDPTPTAQILPTLTPFNLPEFEISEDFKTPTPLLERDLQIFAETEHFIIYSERDYLPVPLVDIEAWAEETYSHVAEQLDADVDQPIYLTFERSVRGGRCYARGYFGMHQATDDSAVPWITVFANPNTSTEQIKAVLAHETAHAIDTLGIEGGISVEKGLSEGLATWAARDYWVEWLGGDSLEGMVRDYLEDDSYFPLVEWFDPYTLPPTADCVERRNIIYTELASFTGWLIDEYGMEAFIDLMESAEETRTETQITRSRADFMGVYGLALNQLAAAWLEWVQTAAE